MGDAHGAQAVGQTVEWYTPSALFDRLGLTFDLDPASSGADMVPWIPAATHLTPDEDGLSRTWYGRVWLNPPYGRLMAPFLDRLKAHGHGIALVYARTETGWWQRIAPRADVVCFLRERLHFIRSDGYQARSQMGSALLAFGEDCATAVVRANLGWIVTKP